MSVHTDHKTEEGDALIPRGHQKVDLDLPHDSAAAPAKVEETAEGGWIIHAADGKEVTVEAIHKAQVEQMDAAIRKQDEELKQRLAEHDRATRGGELEPAIEIERVDSAAMRTEGAGQAESALQQSSAASESETTHSVKATSEDDPSEDEAGDFPIYWKALLTRRGTLPTEKEMQ